MRIISGSKGGIKIKGTHSLKIRPTKDVTKESVFNILNNRLDYNEIIALDLFSGSGCISYELASRGVKKIIAIEQNAQCFNFIKKTITELNFDGSVSVMKGNVLQILKALEGPFDIIFADPPYNFNKYLELYQTIVDHNLLAKTGLLIIEHGYRTQLDTFKHFQFKRKYGRSVCSFLKAPTGEQL